MMRYPQTPWWKSWFKPSRAIEMPGSPYLDEPPKGLWTWPRLLKLVGLPTVTFLAACAYYGVLLEAMGIMIATVLVLTWIRR